MQSLKELINHLDLAAKIASKIGDCNMKNELVNRIKNAESYASELQVVVDSCDK
jgi:hypothetical protein